MDIDQIEDGVLAESTGPSIPKSMQPDMVAGRYHILANEPLKNLDNDFVKYFNARDNGLNTEYYAIVFEKHFSYQIDIVEKFQHARNLNIYRPIDYEVTYVTALKGEYLVAIIPKYNPQNTLQRYIKDNGPLDSRVLASKFLPQMFAILGFCEQYKLQCGNIDPSNIIIEGEDFYLREPFICPPNFYQKPDFLPTELFDCHPAARVATDISTDSYALGMLIYYMITGVQANIKFPEAEFKEKRLVTGTYITLAPDIRASNDIKNLLKGLLHDSFNERWKPRSMMNWLQGKASQVISNDNVEAISPLVFNEKSFLNRQALARELNFQWDKATSFIIETRLVKWAQRSLGNTELADNLEEMRARAQLKTLSGPNYDEGINLFKTIRLLDPEGPIRFRGHIYSFLSLPQVIAYNVISQNKEQLESVIKILTGDYWSTTVALNDKFLDFAEYLALVENSTKLYNPESIGFGVERLLYNLLPKLPCLSSHLGGHYVNNIADLLKVLDNISATNSEAPIIDKHIISFIASKIGLRKDPKIRSLREYPNIAKNPTINALSVFVLAQQNTPSIKINNLGKLIATRLIEIINEKLHNVKLKRELSQEINKAGNEGNLSKMLNIISNSTIIRNDYNGYQKACKEVFLLNEHIKALNYDDNVNRLGYFLGLRITVLFSYLVLIIVTVILLV